MLYVAYRDTVSTLLTNLASEKKERQSLSDTLYCEVEEDDGVRTGVILSALRLNGKRKNDRVTRRSFLYVWNERMAQRSRSLLHVRTGTLDSQYISRYVTMQN